MRLVTMTALASIFGLLPAAFSTRIVVLVKAISP
jgi:hypothetical protein